VNAHKHGLDHTRIANVYFFKININVNIYEIYRKVCDTMWKARS
jgi:hypothetical protein